MQKFDFDEWAELARSDPQLFEKRRRQAVGQVIASAPRAQQPRLRGLQWRVDIIRKKYKDPRVSTHRIFSLMWESVYGTNGLLDALHLKDMSVDSRQKPASILRFDRSRKAEQV